MSRTGEMDKLDTDGPTPTLRFPEFDDGGPWQRETLRRLASPVKDKATGGDNEDTLTLSGEMGLVPQGDYFGKQISGENVSRYIKIVRDDFVYNDRTTKASKFGSIKRLTSTDGGIVSPIYKCFRFKRSQNPDFWDYYFEAQAHEAQLGGLVNEGARAGRFNISIDKFLSIDVWKPSSPEQDRIAECLASIDALIEAEIEKLDALKDHKQGLMQQLFPAEGESLPALRFPEFVEHDGWAFSELGPMTDKVGSGVTPKGGDANYKTSGRPFLRSQNVGWGLLILEDVAHIDEETHQNMIGTELIKGDVLLNITGASIGRSAIADSRVEGGNVNQHVCIIRVKPEELNPEFVKQYLISSLGQSQIDQCQAGGNRQGLNFQQIRSFSIPLPPTLDEQRIIASALQSADEFLSEQASRLETLKNHKQGLLQQLFPVLDEVDG